MRKHRQTKDCDDVAHHATVGQKWDGEVKEKRNWILRNINRVEFLQGRPAESMKEEFQEALVIRSEIMTPTGN